MRTTIIYGAISAFVLTGCVEFRENQVFNDIHVEQEKPFHLSEEIYSDYMTSDAWVTPATSCLTVSTSVDAAKEGDLGLKISWNKTSAGCPWLGLGFGWDNWTGKDLSIIKNTGAIEFYVKLSEGERTSLPWAMGFEDFTGAQAWLGLNANVVKADKITTEWTRIELPLSEFNWDEQGADASNIKQVIIQFEADGEVMLDEIRLVPYTGGYRKRVSVAEVCVEAGNLEKQRDILTRGNSVDVGPGQLYLGHCGNTIFIAGEVKDDTPLSNTKSGRNIYDGDAIELAFSTDFTSYQRRTLFRSTDRHFAIRMSSNPMVFDFTSDEVVENAMVLTERTADGYRFVAAIPYTKEGENEFVMTRLYGLELAIDASEGDSRGKQYRWNNNEVDGFFKNPALWGEMLIQTRREADL
ncbi:sugar-binding protein [Phaeocystidibacter luteus]|uniref:Uncharacterized protein n=1 Tax=Phaeocystidibacter luteus TaxID=911197 RepID=A0A6N6RG51_9FLAO|nr:sugar-binding protein [Phaeocystidibacter luteus]KAB2807359.1 hypothetical protein F8C67_12340 [Phaeocystidibacter luteus]